MTAAPEQAMERSIRLVDLYPEVMNVYADRGNVIAERARCARLGVGCEVTAVGLGDALPSDADLVLIGGGQDREQRRIVDELAAHGPTLRAWAEADTAMLAVCGGFQLFGNFYRTAAGEQLPGIGIFDMVTVAPGRDWERCIGDVLAQPAFDGFGEVVGFENHAGRTYLGPAARPFARVLRGWGNNGDDGSEGALYRQAVGTYLHGSLLPKNVELMDRLILAALRHRYGEHATIEPVEDHYAERAYRSAVAVAKRRGRPNPR